MSRHCYLPWAPSGAPAPVVLQHFQTLPFLRGYGAAKRGLNWSACAERTEMQRKAWHAGFEARRAGQPLPPGAVRFLHKVWRQRPDLWPEFHSLRT